MKSDEYSITEFLDKYGAYISKYEKANPKWHLTSLGRLVHHCANNLRLFIEDANEEIINWNYPHIYLQAPVDVERINGNIWPAGFVLKRNAIEGDESTGLLNELRRILDILTIRMLTNETALFKETSDDKEGYIVLPRKVGEALQGLSEEKQRKEIDRLYDIHPVKMEFEADVKDEITGTRKHVKPIFTIKFDPLIIDQAESRAYYPLYISLKFDGFQPGQWSEKAKREFWRLFFWQIGQTFPKENLDFETEIPGSGDSDIKTLEKTSIPDSLVTLKPHIFEIAGREFVKAALHFEKSKFTPKSLDDQANWGKLLRNKTKEDIQKYNISTVGLDVNQSQIRAIHAIQVLLNRTNYKGNLPPEIFPQGRNPFKYEGDVPKLRFKIYEYLDAFGVSKNLTSRGKVEFSGGERNQALQALNDLANKKFLFIYERHNFTKEGEKTVTIDAVDSIIKITNGWAYKAESDDYSGETHIEMRPSIALIDQVDTYYVLKPANYIGEIKIIFGNKAPKYLGKFIEWVSAETAFRESRSRGKGNLNWELKLNYKTIASKLRMHKYMKNRQWKRVRKYLNQCYDGAKELGYLLDYETVQGSTKEIDVLQLNPDKFWKAKEQNEKGRTAAYNHDDGK